MSDGPERRQVQKVVGVRRVGHVDLLTSVGQLRENATPFDAVYVALVESLDAGLPTRDRQLSSLPGVLGVVETIG